jgi:hypothetical protein
MFEASRLIATRMSKGLNMQSPMADSSNNAPAASIAVAVVKPRNLISLEFSSSHSFPRALS